MRLGHALRLGGAVALLVGGLAHLDLYLGGYRSAGSVPAFGRGIFLNALVSVVVAVAVAVRSEWLPRERRASGNPLQPDGSGVRAHAAVRTCRPLD